MSDENVFTIHAPSTPPDWVKEAQQHFYKYGYYRPADLNRLLGDPRECLEIKISGDGTSSLTTKNVSV